MALGAGEESIHKPAPGQNGENVFQFPGIGREGVEYPDQSLSGSARTPRSILPPPQSVLGSAQID